MPDPAGLGMAWRCRVVAGRRRRGYGGGAEASVAAAQGSAAPCAAAH